MKTRHHGFTLIELLVVISIIALLIAILLPSLGRARALSRAIKCGAQMRSLGAAIAGYNADNDGYFPASYVYVSPTTGVYDPQQSSATPHAYEHWSYALFGYNNSIKAFTCPEFDYGGAPANPGKNASYWLGSQYDTTSNSSPASASIEDLQAPFVAFCANSAIIPRNKFTLIAATSDTSNGTAGNGQRLNRYVRRVMVENESRTILATEYNKNWIAECTNDSGNNICKSHRPLNPFFTFSGGSDEYQTSLSDFFVPTSISKLMDGNSAANAGVNTIADPQTQLNDVGRNHPGSYSKNGIDYGGTSNFIYVDGHVERKNIVQTMTPSSGAWEWGNQYYSINGDNHVQF